MARGSNGRSNKEVKKPKKDKKKTPPVTAASGNSATVIAGKTLN